MTTTPETGDGPAEVLSAATSASNGVEPPRSPQIQANARKQVPTMKQAQTENGHSSAPSLPKPPVAPRELPHVIAASPSVGIPTSSSSSHKSAPSEEIPKGSYCSLKTASSESAPHRHTKASKHRALGHYPPRPESRQESPPTAFIDTQNQSQITEGWNEISTQFEESVGKPSREALHKFFYPPGNASPQPRSPRHRLGKAHLSPRARERIKEKASLHTTRKNEADPTSSGSDTGQREPDLQHTDAAARSIVPEPPPLPLTVDSDGEKASSIRPRSTQQEMNVTPQRIMRRTLSGDSSADSLSSPYMQQPSLSLPSTSNFHRSFDAQEEEDRKYVEAFWTIYDDIIMLSLFTQLGVVARLAASTWFTFFDGVFRADSPLFTNLPLNCLSCFLMGLLGSGDRLMETITTRFTPRNLQQSIVREGASGEDDGDDHSVDRYEDDEEEGGDFRPKDGLRRRKRRPKRAKREAFHSWEPPLHWHDDLREVQLLALERRIRASKCLVLFPVMKEDADVMEHYFGEGYKSSAKKEPQRRQHPVQQQQHPKGPRRNRRRRRRLRFGRQKYNATNLGDTDDKKLLQEGHDSWSCDELEYSDDDFDQTFQKSRSIEDTDKEPDGYEDDGRFRFDLELTETRAKKSAKAAPRTAGEQEENHSEDATNFASPAASLPPSVQKLIKRPPGLINKAPSSSTSSEVAPHTNVTQRTRMEGAEMQPRQAGAPGYQMLDGPPNSRARRPQTESPIRDGSVPDGGMGSNSQSVRVSQTNSMDQSLGTASGGEEADPQLEHIISNVQANVSENISRMRRVNIADGWDVGSTPEAMADDLMLGLRDGFCGALSSFSSWNSSMLNLLREGHIGEAFVGYMLGIQLPIVSYRFGQHIAVYLFIWRCRRETRREERKGWYGIRVSMEDDDGDCDDGRRERTGSTESMEDCFEDERSRARSAETSLEDDAVASETPSVRAICTALYLLALVTQCTSLSFFSEPQDHQIALSLLFSPVGTLTRWRLSRFNCWRPGFPMGTFACNILACALGGSLGGLLAGNPGPKERIFLQSLIAGFAGTLSSLATFIVEILAGMDPLLFRFDGVIYAVCSVAWALIVGFIFSASADWADEVAS